MEDNNFIKGSLYKEIYRNEINSYMVGLFKIKESGIDDFETGDIINITGTLPKLSDKKEYILYGNVVNHPKYGIQFNVDGFNICVPTKEEELVIFLSSDLFPIGEKTAKKIVDTLKDDVINKILENKDCLKNIPRLTDKRIDRIYEVLKDYQDTSSVVIELTKLGFEMKESLSFLNKYNNKILDTVNNNIYELIDSDDMSFTKIDEIAINMGIDEEDDRRIKALIIYVMKNLCFNNGDTYLEEEEISFNLSTYVSITPEKFDYLIMQLVREGKIVIEDKRYYLKKFYDAERYICERLCFLNDMSIMNNISINKYIDNSKFNNITYDDTQLKAIESGVNNNITIITGGPGTGKTTIIKAIVNIIMDSKRVRDTDIALLAPTGRAAKKMMETTGLPAYTIHKYLGWDKDTNTFATDEYCPNKEKYIIVDEVSMIDTLLMEALLKGIKRDIHLILVGDYYQLPSVSEGQILKDLIDSDCLPVIRLNKIYRQNEGSYILNLAYDVKNKNISEDLFIKKDDYLFINSDNDNTLSYVKEVVSKAIKKGYSDMDIQVLAPMYKGNNGIDNLNIMLQELFNPKDKSKKEIAFKDVIYREYDKVLQLVNDPDNNVYNGDIGYIEEIIVSDGKKVPNQININYDGNIVEYTPDKFINFRHGYAISIHKAQGSEFDTVIIPITSNFKRMLYNKLVYTGVTRAKKSLIIVGEPNSFIYGINNDYVDNRKTTLKDFIINKYNI
ncbi:MAG: ATP-dependent RecD-like DNA helicase [Bacilli bacterium]